MQMVLCVKVKENQKIVWQAKTLKTRQQQQLWEDKTLKTEARAEGLMFDYGAQKA